MSRFDTGGTEATTVSRILACICISIGCFMRCRLRIAYENGLRYAVKLFGFRIFGSESEEKDTESRSVREGTQAADSDELEFVNAQEKTEDDDLDTGELILRAEAASEKTDAAIEKAEETARLLEEAVKRRSAQREAEMSQAVKNADAFPDVKEAGVSEAEGKTHRARMN